MDEKGAIERDWKESGPERYRKFLEIQDDIKMLLYDWEEEYCYTDEDELMDFYEISRKQLCEEYDIGFRDIMKIGCR